MFNKSQQIFSAEGKEEASKVTACLPIGLSNLQAEPFRAKIKSVGLDSSEMDWPPKLFREAYRLAAEQGYRLTAHAGMPFSS